MTDELISKTDVVKIVKSVLSPASSLTNVARARRQMLDQIYELESKPEPHWIPVTEEPKKEEKSYWVCLEDGGQCQCRWTNDVYGIGANPWSKWGWKKVDLPQFSKVVAYMPLPEPYKPTVPPEYEGDCGCCKPSVIEKCKGVTE